MTEFRTPHESQPSPIYSAANRGERFQVCVAGWYFFRDYYNHLENIDNVHVIAHREHPLRAGFAGCVRPNVGLEWGAYHHFLMNFWNGVDPVLFTHDDMRVTCSAADFVRYVRSLVEHPAVMAGPSYTQFFVLKSEALEKIRNEGGFWYDEENHGNVTHNKWQVNRGARSFRAQLKRLGIQYEQVSGEGTLEIAKRGAFAPPS